MMYLQVVTNDARLAPAQLQRLKRWSALGGSAYHSTERMQRPAQHCMRMEMLLRLRSSPASKNARPGVILRTHGTTQRRAQCSRIQRDGKPGRRRWGTGCAQHDEAGRHEHPCGVAAVDGHLAWCLRAAAGRCAVRSQVGRWRLRNCSEAMASESDFRQRNGFCLKVGKAH